MLQVYSSSHTLRSSSDTHLLSVPRSAPLPVLVLPGKQVSSVGRAFFGYGTYSLTSISGAFFVSVSCFYSHVVSVVYMWL